MKNIEEKYDKINSFSEGYAAVKKNNQWGYINLLGELVIPIQFQYGGPFCEGLALVNDLKGLTGYIDYTGNTVIPCQYYYGHDFSEGLAFVSVPGKSYMFIDKTGKEAILLGNMFTAFSLFQNGIVLLGYSNIWLHMDKNGQIAKIWIEKVEE